MQGKDVNIHAMKRSVVTGLVLSLSLLIAFPVAHAAMNVPFGPGEKLTYEIHWTFIHAGDAVLEVMPDTEMGGVPARHFKATARTVPWVDKFYEVRDSMDAWTNMDVTHALRYKKDQNEGSYHKKVDLIFDKEKNQSLRYVRGDLKHTIDQPEDVFDPMSVLFSFRKQILYKTMQSGVFQKSKDAEILVWFSADKRRIPVKVRSKVKVGHFTMELVDYRPPTADNQEVASQ